MNADPSLLPPLFVYCTKFDWSHQFPYSNTSINVKIFYNVNGHICDCKTQMLNLTWLHPHRKLKHFSPSACCVRLGCLNDAILDININKLLHKNWNGDFSLPLAILTRYIYWQCTSTDISQLMNHLLPIPVYSYTICHCETEQGQARHPCNVNNPYIT